MCHSAHLPLSYTLDSFQFIVDPIKSWAYYISRPQLSVIEESTGRVTWRRNLVRLTVSERDYINNFRGQVGGSIVRLPSRVPVTDWRSFLYVDFPAETPSSLLLWILWWPVLFIPITFAVMAIGVPIAFAMGWVWVGDMLHDFLDRFCHQMPSRTLWLWGYPFGLCVRCLAIYTTFSVVGFRLVLRKSKPMRSPIAVSLVFPMFVDISLQLTGVWSGHNWIRGITGVLFGIGSASLLWLGVWSTASCVDHMRFQHVWTQNACKLAMAGLIGVMAIFLIGQGRCASSGDDDGNGGGGNGGADGVSLQAIALSSPSAAINAILALLLASEAGEDVLKSSSAATKSFGVGETYKSNWTRSLTSILNERFDVMNLPGKTIILQQTTNCPDGGTFEIIENIQTDTESRLTVRYDQCRTRFVDNNGTEVERLLDGFAVTRDLQTIDISSALLEQDVTFENLTVQTSIVSSGIVLEKTFANLERRDIVTINDFTTCGGSFTGSFSLTANGTIIRNQDLNTDGDFSDDSDTDTSEIFTNYVSSSEVIGSTDSSCNISITEANLTTSGGAGLIDNNNPGKSFAVNSPSSEPLRINQRVEPGGMSFSLNGTQTSSVDEPCIEENMLTFRFTTTERIFLPDSQRCPTSGQVIVIQGGEEITVTYTDSGGVVVSSVDTEEIFDSCDDIVVCPNGL